MTEATQQTATRIAEQAAAETAKSLIRPGVPYAKAAVLVEYPAGPPKEPSVRSYPVSGEPAGSEGTETYARLGASPRAGEGQLIDIDSGADRNTRIDRPDLPKTAPGGTAWVADSHLVTSSGQSNPGTGEKTANSALDTAKGVASQAKQSALDTSYKAKVAADTVGNTAGKAAGVAGQGVQAAKDTAGSTYNAAKDTAGSAYNTAKGTAGSAYDAAKGTAGSAYEAAKGTAGSAYDAAKGTADSAYDAAKGTAGSAYDAAKGTAGTAYDAAKGTAGSAYNAAKGTAGYAYDAAKGTAGAAYDAAKGAAGTATNLASEGAQYAKDAAGSTYDAAKGAAGYAAEMAGQGVEAAKDTAGAAYDMASQGVEVAQETAGEAMEQAGSWAAWGQHQVSQASSSVYETTVKPLVSLWWYLFVTLPYNIMAAMGHAAWNTTSWMWSSGTDAGTWLAGNASAGINKVADVAFHVMLGSLRTVNTHMDKLINNTPRLLHKTLAAAKARKEAGGSTQALATPEGEGAEGGPTLGEEEPLRITELEMTEETDIARAANEALHRVFDKQQQVDTSQAEGARSTLLAEARKLAWHAWMLVALQVTAIRTVLRVTEGMLGWVVSAWAQLATAALILSAMTAAAPVAAVAGAFAWSCHFVLKQLLSLRSYRHTAQAYVGPPLHSVMLTLHNFLSPYVKTQALEGVEGEQGVQQVEKVEVQRREVVEGEEFVEHEEQHEEHHESPMSRLMSVMDVSEVQQVVAKWLDSGLAFTEHLLPPQQAGQRGVEIEEIEGEEEGGEEDLSSSSTSSTVGSSSVGELGESLEDACEGAEQAYSKASSLAAATAYTVADTVRVVLIGLATRFDLPLPTWIPGLQPGEGAPGSPTLAQEPAMAAFNETAGTGPASGAQAVGAALRTGRSRSRGRASARQQQELFQQQEQQVAAEQQQE